MIKLMASAEFISDQSRDPDLHSFSTRGRESASTESSESLSRFHQKGKSRNKEKRREREGMRDRKREKEREISEKTTGGQNLGLPPGDSLIHVPPFIRDVS